MENNELPKVQHGLQAHLVCVHGGEAFGRAKDLFPVVHEPGLSLMVHCVLPGLTAPGAGVSGDSGHGVDEATFVAETFRQIRLSHSGACGTVVVCSPPGPRSTGTGRGARRR